MSHPSLIIANATVIVNVENPNDSIRINDIRNYNGWRTRIHYLRSYCMVVSIMKSLIACFTSIGLLVGFMGGVIFWSSAANASETCTAAALGTAAPTGAAAGALAGAKIGAGTGMVGGPLFSVAGGALGAIIGGASGLVAGVFIGDEISDRVCKEEKK